MPLVETLRAATRDDHAALDGHGFNQALAAGTLPWPAFVSFLHAMAVLHTGIESGCADDRWLADAGVWRPSLARATRISADLDAVADPGMPVAVGALAEALRAGRQLRRTAQAEPAAWLGALYVVVGSRRGGPVVDRHARACFPDRLADGLDHLAPMPPKDWARFLADLDAVVLSDAQQAAAVDAARLVFDAVHDVLDALHPLDQQTLSLHAAALNPEAGAHPITTDPVALAVALDAGQQTWDAYPYFQARYAERGQRYSRSDSGWLVSVAGFGAQVRQRQVDWLAGVLAARGMPSMLLEHQLRALADGLERARPDQAGNWRGLADCADVLAARRDAALPPKRRDQLAASFPAGLDQGLPEAPALVVCAVADQAAGLHGAEDSLLGWLADPERFPADWCGEIKGLRARARAALPGAAQVRATP